MSTKSVKSQVVESAKELWDKLKKAYEGDTKVKNAKLQSYRIQFECLKMEESEDITTYFLCIDEVVNTMRGLGETIENGIIVKKVLRSLPARFDPKISSLEERTDIATLLMDELQRILTSYEMRTSNENSSNKEASFKEAKKDKKKVEIETGNHEDSEENRFEGYCFFCYKYGHKETFCNVFLRNISAHNSHGISRFEYERRHDKSIQNNVNNSHK
jgi:hypothetical protein